MHGQFQNIYWKYGEILVLKMTLRLLLMKYVIYFIICFVPIMRCTKKESYIVARFGDHTITMDEFRTAYLQVLKQPTKFDSPKLRVSILDELINRRLLADEARTLKLDNDERFQLKLETYLNKCLREAHYEYVIEPKVQIEDSLLREIYQYTREQRKVKHLFFAFKEQADSAYTLLQQGVSFDELAMMTFADSLLAHSGGDLGWVQWDQLDYALAMQAFRQEVNTYSQPVKSEHGYHILKIENNKKELFVTEDDYQLQRDKILHLVKSKMGDQFANEYIDQMMQSLDIQVRTQELEVVGKTLYQFVNRQTGDSTKLPQDSLYFNEAGTIENDLWEIRDRPLFLVNGQSFTVGQFISNIPYMPSGILRKSLKTVLDYSIRDFQLTEEAKKLGLDNKSQTVHVKTKIFEEYLLQMMLRKKIIDDIVVTDDEIKATYEKLTASKENVKPYTNFKDELTSVVRREKRTTEVPNFINKLRTGLDIKKNTDIVHAYYDSLH